MGLLMTGGAGTWFDSLGQDIRQNYEQLQEQFRQTYIDVEHTRLQRQMATLTRVQQTGETVDSYFTDARSKLAEHNFDQNFQLTLLINGLRSDIKGLVMQHQPYQNVGQLLNKARHVEASLRAAPFNPYLATANIPAVASIAKEEMFATTSDLEKIEKSIIEKVTAKLNEFKVGNRKETEPQYIVPRVTSTNNQGNLGRCFICGSTSHFRRDCTFQRPNTSFHNAQNGNFGRNNNPRAAFPNRRINQPNRRSVRFANDPRGDARRTFGNREDQFRSGN